MGQSTPAVSPSDVIERIYDAALSPLRWGDAMAAFRSAFDALAAGLFVTAAEDHRLLSSVFDGIADAELESYSARFAANNPWQAVPGLLAPGHTVSDMTLERFHGRSDAFLRSEMCQEWCLPQDFRHALGGGIVDVEGNLLKFTLFRPKQAGHYAAQELGLYEQLRRHMLKAVEINRQLAGAQAQLRIRDTILDQLRIGVVALDWMQRILHCNVRARRMFASRAGVYAVGSRLTASPPHAAGLLDAAIAGALKGRRSSSVAIGRAGHEALSVSVLPVTERRSFFDLDRVHVLVLIADPQDRSVGDSGYLARRWQLAPVEARFALHLLRGKSVAEVAEAMGLTRASAQWYAKQLLAKLGVRRQSELVLKMMSDLPVFVESTHGTLAQHQAP